MGRLKDNEISKDELLKCLDSMNPVIIYEAITCIVKNHIRDKMVIDKLIQLSELLSDEYKMLGYYKIGHAAMGALLTLGINEKIVFRETIDGFEKDMVVRFLQSAWYN